MKIKCAYSILILILIYVNTAYSAIVGTYSINSQTIKDISTVVDSSTLVLISVDDVILTPQSNIFKYDSPYKSFIDNIASLANKPRFARALSNWFTNRKLMLVENDWPNFIINLKKTGATVLGFVQLHPQIYHIIKEPELLKDQELKKFNIEFTDKLNKQGLFKIHNCGTTNSVFYNGIIFTGDCNKAETLVHLLKVTNNIPKKIIVFDNIKDSINQIQEVLKVYDTDYYGVHYLGLMDLKGSPKKEVFNLQQQKLINEGLWLEDVEAEQIVKAKEPQGH